MLYELLIEFAGIINSLIDELRKAKFEIVVRLMGSPINITDVKLSQLSKELEPICVTVSGIEICLNDKSLKALSPIEITGIEFILGGILNISG